MSIIKFSMCTLKRIMEKNFIGKHREYNLQDNLAFFQSLVDTNPNPFYYEDANGILKYCNDALAEYFSLNKSEVIGRLACDVFPREITNIFTVPEMEIVKSKEKFEYTIKLKLNDEQIHHLLINKVVVYSRDGKINGVLVNIIDITNQIISEKKVNRMLKLREAMLDINNIIIKENDIDVLLNLVLDKVASAMGNADIGCVMVLDEDENLRIVASKGYDVEEARQFKLKLNQAFYIKQNNGKIGNTVIINNIQSLDMSDHATALESKDGAKLQCAISTPIFLEGKLYGFINIESSTNNVFDETDIEVLDYLKNQIEVGVSKNKLYEETIYLSRFDKLTNVYNRRYFEELFDFYLKPKTDELYKNFLVVVFDLNGLKIVNDTYGHLAGDELIKGFAQRLKTKISPKDILARIGGDEFSAIFFNIDSQDLIQMLKNLSKEFCENPLIIEGNQIICSFSYGISAFPQDGLNYTELIKTADKKMYDLKHNRIK